MYSPGDNADLDESLVLGELGRDATDVRGAAVADTGVHAGQAAGAREGVVQVEPLAETGGAQRLLAIVVTHRLQRHLLEEV